MALDQVKLQVGVHLASPAQSVTLVPGTYRVTLTSTDPSHPDSPNDQLTEQWYAELRGPGGVVANSGVIGDLPTASNTMTQGVGTVTVPAGTTVTGVRAVHAFPTAGNHQSIFATRACFTPVV